MSPLTCTACNKPGKAAADPLMVSLQLLLKKSSWVVNSPCSICLRSFIDANMLKKKRQRVLNQLGGFSQQGDASSVQGKDQFQTGAGLLKSRCSSQSVKVFSV